MPFFGTKTGIMMDSGAEWSHAFSKLRCYNRLAFQDHQYFFTIPAAKFRESCQLVSPNRPRWRRNFPKLKKKVPSQVKLDGLSLPIHLAVVPDNIRTFWCSFFCPVSLRDKEVKTRLDVYLATLPRTLRRPLVHTRGRLVLPEVQLPPRRLPELRGPSADFLIYVSAPAWPFGVEGNK